MKYERVHKVLGEGNFVLVASEGSFAGRATSFYDLFRIKKTEKSQSFGTRSKPLHRARNGKTRTVNSDYQIAAPECPVLEQITDMRH
jgi:hypothetical protein